MKRRHHKVKICREGYGSSAGDEKVTGSQSRSLLEDRVDVSASGVSKAKKIASKLLVRR